MVLGTSMRCRRWEDGFLAVEWILGICVIAVVSVIIFPHAASLIAKWEVDYEANALLRDIRHVQMLARTTQDMLVGDDIDKVQAVPEIQLFPYGYRIDGDYRVPSELHRFLPHIRIALVPLRKEVGDLRVIRYARNGYLETVPLRIYFMIEGEKRIYKQIVLHKSGRSRMGEVSDADAKR